MAKIITRGTPTEPAHINNLVVASRGWGVVSGLAVSEKGAGANMSVDVATGEVIVNGTVVTKASTTPVAITSAHATYDRYDLVVINSSGTISVVAGTAGATSYANDYDLETNNAILLAEVEVPANDTTIEDAQITDHRLIIEQPNIKSDWSITGSKTVDTSYQNGTKRAIVIATGVADSTNAVKGLQLLSDSSDPATTVICKSESGSSADLYSYTVIAPIQPSDYYKVTASHVTIQSYLIMEFM